MHKHNTQHYAPDSFDQTQHVKLTSRSTEQIIA